MKNRTRVLAFAALLTAVPASLFAQQKSDPAQFQTGSKILSVDLLAGGSGAYAGIGAAAAFEVGVTKIANRVTLGVGGSLGIMHDSYGYLANSSVSVNQFMFFLLANGHYQLTDVPQLDLYAGISAGFTNWSYSSSANGFTRSGTTDPAGGVQAGARWNFSDHVSAMAQVGEGVKVPILQAGLTFKF